MPAIAVGGAAAPAVPTPLPTSEFAAEFTTVFNRFLGIKLAVIRVNGFEFLDLFLSLAFHISLQFQSLGLFRRSDALVLVVPHV